MATWIDVVVFLLTIVILGGIVWGIVSAVNATSTALQTTKENLKNKGLNITDTGVSVKTTGRFDREDYVDATQRGFIRAMSASSFGTPANQSPGTPKRQDSSSGASIPEEKEKKKGILHSLKRGHDKTR